MLMLDTLEMRADILLAGTWKKQLPWQHDMISANSSQLSAADVSEGFLGHPLEEVLLCTDLLSDS